MSVVTDLPSGPTSQVIHEEAPKQLAADFSVGRSLYSDGDGTFLSLPPYLWYFQDVNETWSLRFPELYEPGQLNLYFNKKEFLKCLVHGIYSSFVLFFIPMGTIFNSVRSDGKEISDYQSFSLTVQTSLLWVVTMQVWTVVVEVKGIGWGDCLEEREGSKEGRWEGRILYYRIGEWKWLIGPRS